MKALSKIDKIKAFIAPKITYIITLLDNNVNLSIYVGEGIYGLYRYL